MGSGPSCSPAFSCRCAAKIRSFCPRAEILLWPNQSGSRLRDTMRCPTVSRGVEHPPYLFYIQIFIRAGQIRGSCPLRGRLRLRSRTCCAFSRPCLEADFLSFTPPFLDCKSVAGRRRPRGLNISEEKLVSAKGMRSLLEPHRTVGRDQPAEHGGCAGRPAGPSQLHKGAENAFLKSSRLKCLKCREIVPQETTVSQLLTRARLDPTGFSLETNAGARMREKSHTALQTNHLSQEKARELLPSLKDNHGAAKSLGPEGPGVQRTLRHSYVTCLKWSTREEANERTTPTRKLCFH